MSDSFWLVVSFFVAVSLAPGAHAKGPVGTLKVGNWSGGAYTNNDTGQFSGCIAAKTYRSGFTIIVMVSPQMTWQLSFVQEKWNLAQGQQLPIVLMFDGKVRFNVVGRSISRNTVTAAIPANSLLINQFRQSRSMSVFARGHLFQFALTSTSVLVPTLITCVGNFATALKPPISELPFGTGPNADTKQNVPAEHQIKR